MTTSQFSSEKEFAGMFNFNIQPRAIKFVNGIAVNINGGSLTINELEVTRKHVSITTYSVELQDTVTHFINPPYIVKY